MEEIKKKKKLNKKPLLICLAIALVFAVIGFIDIKSNAAESYTVNTYMECLFSDGTFAGCSDKNATSSSPFYVYVLDRPELSSTQLNAYSYVMSRSSFALGGNPCKSLVDNEGVTWYYYQNFSGLYPVGTTQKWTITGTENVYYLKDDNAVNTFLEDFKSGAPDIVIDYSSFETDYDMPVPTNIKRNIVVEDAWDSFTNTWYVDNSYEYLLWKNTSDLKIQIQTLPVVQYFEEKVGRVNFSQQFHGNTWNDSQILDVGVCNYTMQTDIDFIKENAESDYKFYRLCLDTKSLTLFEKSYFFYAYRLRYVDETNEVAGPWLCVYPNEILNGTNTFIIDSSGEITNSDSNMGEVVEKPLGESTLDETLKDIENTLEFKDKYEIVDGDVDTQEATNWLYSVVNFIKGTPQVVGSVLGFLPQPILYGMYVCIFLGIIASGLAIVKALL